MVHSTVRLHGTDSPCLLVFLRVVSPPKLASGVLHMLVALIHTPGTETTRSMSFVVPKPP